jgi:hypothetical protein
MNSSRSVGVMERDVWIFRQRFRQLRQENGVGRMIRGRNANGTSGFVPQNA